MTTPDGPHGPAADGASPHAVDETLRRYFAAEMPSPWPPAPRVVAHVEPLPSARRAGLGRSHFALAASLLILAAGMGLCRDLNPDPTRGRSADETEAVGPPSAHRPASLRPHRPPSTRPATARPITPPAHGPGGMR
jgi:hypothetical protein